MRRNRNITKDLGNVFETFVDPFQFVGHDFETKKTNTTADTIQPTPLNNKIANQQTRTPKEVGDQWFCFYPPNLPKK